MTLIIIISIIIIFAVILLSVLAVNKGYQYKHTIDPEPISDEGDKSQNNTNSKI